MIFLKSPQLRDATKIYKYDIEVGDIFRYHPSLPKEMAKKLNPFYHLTKLQDDLPLPNPPKSDQR